MPLEPLQETKIKELVTQAGLDGVGEIRKIPVGFSNDVYSVSGRYIFKANRSRGDELYLQKEMFLCNLLKGTVPAPTIFRFDDSKTLTDRVYIIYEKIEGDNLYMKWHECSVDERKALIKQICSFLRIINGTPLDSYAKAFNIDTSRSWRQVLTARIEEWMERAERTKSVSPGLAEQVRAFVEKNGTVLDESKIALTYFDAHFDNFIIRGGEIVGMLDFERTGIFSIDYALDVVARMVGEPKKYASESAEPLVVAEDYAPLMDWYREYYPELFQFKDIPTRLKLYAIDHDLENTYWWPESDSLKKELSRNSKL